MHKYAAQVLCVFLTTVAAVPSHAKLFPSNADRDWRCPNALRSHAMLPSGYHKSSDSLDNVTVHPLPMSKYPSMGLLNNTAVIAIKRVFDPLLNQTIPYFKYFGHNESFAVETWSCSKIFSAMNGAGRLGESCTRSLGSDCGLADSTTGDYGVTPLGDLVTIIVTYDTTHPPYSSNALGGWFEMVGTRARARYLVHEWLQRPADEWLGANYGNDPPSDLNFTFFNGTEATGSFAKSSRTPSTTVPGLATCAVQPDTPHNGDFNNTLSSLTMAEMLKRIVLSRELPTPQRFPNTSWEDSKVLLYGAGAENSRLFPNQTWGGMSADAADAVRLGVNMTEMEEKSGGMYRTFAKDGAGYSYIRYAGEITFNGYACYPDAANPENGVEYVISSRISIPLDTHLEIASKLYVEAMTQINQAILAGDIG